MRILTFFLTYLGLRMIDSLLQSRKSMPLRFHRIDFPILDGKYFFRKVTCHYFCSCKTQYFSTKSNTARSEEFLSYITSPNIAYVNRPCYSSVKTTTNDFGANATNNISKTSPKSDVGIIFASDMEMQRNKRKRINQIPLDRKVCVFILLLFKLGLKLHGYKVGRVDDRDFGRNYATKSFEHFSTLPNQPGLQLDYDYLAVNSIYAIEVNPIVKKTRGEWILNKWWNAAKKWNLLNGTPFLSI